MRIGEILSRLYGIKAEDIQRALDIQKEVGGYLGQILIQTGLISELQLLQSLSEQLNFPVFISGDGAVPTDEILSYLEGKADINFIISNGFVPVLIDHAGRVLGFATGDPLNRTVTDYLMKSLDYGIALSLASEQTIKEISKQYSVYYSSDDAISLQLDDSPERLKEMAFEAPVIKYLNGLLSRAVELASSDIHLEPSETKHKVRFRIDGVLQTIDTVNESFYLALVSRIKLLSNLDIAEKRLPQDGKFSIRLGLILLDLRISTIPTVKGEDVVIRLLYREKLSFGMKTLGQKEDHYSLFIEMALKPYGMILVTGPTGSGKTTTLYTLLTYLNNNAKKIITIEDPVEYQLEGLNQIQVKSDIDFTFASALRSILRHDPDIIMVGEIRDSETAKISIQSALTGHLVLSTLHTNDAPSSLFRLLDMGVEDYLINAAVIGIIAQRIIRVNCPYCSAEERLPEDIMTQYGIRELFGKFSKLTGGEMTFKKGKGCNKCAGTGYRGRTSVFEMFRYDEDLKELFLGRHSVDAVAAALRERPYFRTLREDGLLKVMEGTTTIEEVLRVT